MILHFDREHVKRLVEHVKSAKELRPIFGQAFDPKYRRDGREPSLDEEITLDDIDPAKLTPALLLVGDQGVYLMTNAKTDHLPGGERPRPAYAIEADPDRVPFGDWWDAKNVSFGGDDGVELIELDAVEQWLARARGRKRLRLELTPESMRFL